MTAFTLENIPSQKGKIAIVTGANVGLGYETTLGLVDRGAKVIMACRNLQKANQTKANILKLYPEADLEVRELDLNSQASVRTFAEGIKTDYSAIHFLINNAGIMMTPQGQTEDGLESQMGVNYFAHFLLTGLLMPLLEAEKGSRVVALSSKAHEWGTIDFNNLNAEQSYSKMGAYSQSKLACLMFAYELQDRLVAAQKHTVSLAAHPGGSNTELGRHFPKWQYYLMLPLFAPMMHAPKQAAKPTLMAALDPNALGGDYFGPTGFRGMRGAPGKVDPKPYAKDKALTKQLWEATEDILNYKFNL